MSLHPTLWRTCRVLAGETRLQLLRRVSNHPGHSVSDLADAGGISRPRASQELRRLQSRGLLQAVRIGRMVRYQPVPDALVPTAAPLLAASQAVFRRYSRSSGLRFAEIAVAFSHPRRIAIVAELIHSPRTAASLRQATGIPWRALKRHLRVLRNRQLVVCQRGRYYFRPGGHPLACCLARIIRDSFSTG